MWPPMLIFKLSLLNPAPMISTLSGCSGDVGGEVVVVLMAWPYAFASSQDLSLRLLAFLSAFGSTGTGRLRSSNGNRFRKDNMCA